MARPCGNIGNEVPSFQVMINHNVDMISTSILQCTCQRREVRLRVLWRITYGICVDYGQTHENAANYLLDLCRLAFNYYKWFGGLSYCVLVGSCFAAIVEGL